MRGEVKKLTIRGENEIKIFVLHNTDLGSSLKGKFLTNLYIVKILYMKSKKCSKKSNVYKT